MLGTRGENAASTPLQALRVPLLASLSLTLAVFLLKSLSRAADREVRLLWQAGWLVEALRESGRFLHGWVILHLMALQLAVLALSVSLCVWIYWRMRTSTRSERALIVASSGLVLSGLFFASSEFAWATFAAVAGGLGLGTSPGFDEETPVTVRRLWPVLIPLAVAFVLRFYALGDYPTGLGAHAAGTHLNAIRLYEELHPAIWSGDLARARGFVEFILGEHMAPNSLIESFGYYIWGFGITQYRFAAATLGCLAVLLAYLLGRAMLDDRLGFLFAFLLAAAPWHVTVSRYANTEHGDVPSRVELLRKK